MIHLAVTHVPTPTIELTPAQLADEELRAWVTLGAMVLGVVITFAIHFWCSRKNK
jgi:formate-dependent nitrite reductase membrane component NrfD